MTPHAAIREGRVADDEIEDGRQVGAGEVGIGARGCNSRAQRAVCIDESAVDWVIMSVLR
ncbi:MAG: hypothetical protein KME20_28030 [Kaiparowitsia implicata GSE-PSE-MK54-09C]|nr:hypothetical protein [Kaiparowitsia implicata GSE-PSE-MK54-09C]